MVIARIGAELRGQFCLSLEDAPAVKKQVIRSRSFDQSVTALAGMREAISTFTEAACVRLRYEGLYARNLTVFIQTSPFAKDAAFYGNAAHGSLTRPLNDTLHCNRLPSSCLKGSGKMATCISRPGWCSGNWDAAVAGRAAFSMSPCVTTAV